MTCFQGKEGTCPIWRNAHGVNKKVAIVGPAAIRRSGIAGIVSLLRAGIAIVPIPLCDLAEDAFSGIADVRDYQVRVSVSEDVRRREKKQRSFFIVRVNP